MLKRNLYHNVGSTFLQHVGYPDSNSIWLPQVEALPKIMSKYLNHEMSYFLLIQMRVKVLQHVLNSGFARKLEAEQVYLKMSLIGYNSMMVRGV